MGSAFSSKFSVESAGIDSFIVGFVVQKMCRREEGGIARPE
jgi:hypothetical protein